MGVFAALLVSAPLQAQNPPDQPSAPDTRAAEPDEQTLPAGWSPFDIPPMNMSLGLPPGATVKASRPTPETTRVVINPENDIWLVTLYDAPNPDRRLSPAGILERFIHQRQQQRFGSYTDNPITVTDRADNAEVAGRPAAHAYLTTPAEGNPLITGVTVIASDADRFIIAQLDTKAADPSPHRDVYKQLVSTITLPDPQAVTAARELLVSAGDRFMKQRTARDLAATFTDEPIFFRIYMPGPDDASTNDDTEIGTQRVEIRRGQLGELDLGKPEDQWNSAQLEYGYLVVVRSRLLHPARAETYAAFFLSRDQTFEAATVITSLYEQASDEAQTTTESIFRREGRLTVQFDSADGDLSNYEATLPERGYLSRVELYMLPRLLANAVPPETGPSNFEFGFYTYDSTQRSLVFRNDRFVREPGEEGWTYTSRPFSFAPEVEAVLDAHGAVIERTIPGNRRIEQMDADQIRTLWQRKGIGQD